MNAFIRKNRRPHPAHIVALAISLAPLIPATAQTAPATPPASIATDTAKSSPNVLEILELPLEAVNRTFGTPVSTGVFAPRISLTAYRLDAYTIEVSFADNVSAAAILSRTDGKPVSLPEVTPFFTTHGGSGERVWSKIGDQSWKSDDDCTAVITHDGKLALTSPLFKRLRLLVVKTAPGAGGEGGQRIAALVTQIDREHESQMHANSLVDAKATPAADTIKELDGAAHQVQGDTGIILRCVADVMKEGESVIQRHNDDAQRAEAINLFAPDTSVSQSDVQGRLATCNALEKSDTDTLTFYSGIAASLKAKLAATTLPPAVADSAEAQVLHGMDSRMVVPRIKLDIKMVTQARVAYKLLSDNPGKWRCVKDAVYIPEAGLRHKFHVALNDLQATQSALEKLQEAVLKN